MKMIQLGWSFQIDPRDLRVYTLLTKKAVEENERLKTDISFENKNDYITTKNLCTKLKYKTIIHKNHFKYLYNYWITSCSYFITSNVR